MLKLVLLLTGKYNFLFPLFVGSIYGTLFLFDCFHFAHGCSLIAQLVKNPSEMQETPVHGLGISAGEGKKLPNPVFWPGESHGLYSPRGHKESQLSGFHFHVLGFSGGSAGRESAYNAGDPGMIPGLGRFPWRRDRLPTPVFLGFLGGSAGKESVCNVEDLGLIPGLGRSPGERLPTPVFWPGELHGLYIP